MTEDEKPEAEKPVKRAPRRKAEGEICPKCWPKGWNPTATNASCSHGNYKR
jgi:hypothetical protein